MHHGNCISCYRAVHPKMIKIIDFLYYYFTTIKKNKRITWRYLSYFTITVQTPEKNKGSNCVALGCGQSIFFMGNRSSSGNIYNPRCCPPTTYFLLLVPPHILLPSNNVLYYESSKDEPKDVHYIIALMM